MAATGARTTRLPATAVLLATTALLLLGVASAGRPRTGGTGGGWWQGWGTRGQDAATVTESIAGPGPGALALPVQLGSAAALIVLILLLAHRLARFIRVRRSVGTEGGSVATGMVRRAAPEDTYAVALAEAASAAAVDVATAGAGSPRELSDAVIAAWVRLETAAAAAGSHRRHHDTAAEFAADLAARWPPVAAPLQTLLALYARARFSDEHLGATDGRRAQAALDRLHRQLVGYGEHAGRSASDVDLAVGA